MMMLIFYIDMQVSTDQFDPMCFSVSFFWIWFSRLVLLSHLLYVSIIGIHESRHNSFITNYHARELHRASKCIWRCSSICFKLDTANAHWTCFVAVASSFFLFVHFISLKFSFSTLNFPFSFVFLFLVKRLFVCVYKKEERTIPGKHWCAWGHIHNTAYKWWRSEQRKIRKSVCGFVWVSKME